MSVRIKISEDGYKALNEVFSIQKEFGPFVKGSDSNDLMLALKLMENGKENGSSKFTKPMLFNIIKALLIQQKWADKVEGEIENVEDEPNTEESSEIDENDVHENEEVKNEIDRKDRENKVQNEEKSKTEKKLLNVKHVCNFYRSAKCIYGMTGKTKDKRGNICQHDHPPICMKFKLFENHREKGCQDIDCDKMHVKHCKYFNTCKDYKAGHNDKDNCRFYHPKKKQKFQVKGNIQTSFQPKEENRYLQENKSNHYGISEKRNFLGQHCPSQVSSWVWENQSQNQSQAYQYKQPFSGPENMQEQNKKEMKDLFTNMEKLFNHAKSIML